MTGEKSFWYNWSLMWTNHLGWSPRWQFSTTRLTRGCLFSINCMCRMQNQNRQSFPLKEPRRGYWGPVSRIKAYCTLRTQPVPVWELTGFAFSRSILWLSLPSKSSTKSQRKRLLWFFSLIGCLREKIELGWVNRLRGSGTPPGVPAKVFENYNPISIAFASDKKKRTTRWVYYILRTKILKLENHIIYIYMYTPSLNNF